jgi:hypothetical protein
MCRVSKFCGIFIVLVMLMFISLGCTPSYTRLEEPIRRTEEEFIEQVEKMHTGISEEELAELNEIAWMAINKLPENEREVLLDLQERFAYGGYKALSDDEVLTMQNLNNKAFSLLPKVYQERLYYLHNKIEQ